jgi:hypothetical protein
MQTVTVLFRCQPGNGEELLRELHGGLVGDRRARDGCE